MSYSFIWEEETIASLLLALLGGVPTGVIGIVSYVLTSMALYTIAQRRQIQKAWLAWVPIFNCWILGSLSDQYRYVAKGQIRSKRKWLLGLNIASMFLSSVVAGMVAGAIINTVRYGSYAGPILTSMMKALLLGLPIAGIGLAITVLKFMSLFDVYQSVDPSNAVLFLVLSILIGIVQPFFLFFNRDKDTGMPPRREVHQEPIWEPENKDYL